MVGSFSDFPIKRAVVLGIGAVAEIVDLSLYSAGCEWFIAFIMTGSKDELYVETASLRCSKSKLLTRAGRSGQPVIPGEHRETRNPGAKAWIPASAGMTNREKPAVSAVALSAPRYGGLAMTARLN